MDPTALKELIVGSSEIALMRGGTKEASKENLRPKELALYR